MTTFFGVDYISYQFCFQVIQVNWPYSHCQTKRKLWTRSCFKFLPGPICGCFLRYKSAICQHCHPYPRLSIAWFIWPVLPPRTTWPAESGTSQNIHNLHPVHKLVQKHHSVLGQSLLSCRWSPVSVCSVPFCFSVLQAKLWCRHKK